MAGYDDQGENPFFPSYQEGPAITKTEFPSLAKRVPMERVYWLIRTYGPGLTLYQRDMVWHELQNAGVLEKIDDPSFEELIKGIVQKVQGKTASAIKAFDLRRGQPLLATHRK